MSSGHTSPQSQHLSIVMNSPTLSQRSQPLKPEEANKQLDKEHITKLTDESFKKIVEYTRAESSVIEEDCNLLQNMNNITKEKYSQMAVMTERLLKDMSKIQKTYDEFENFISQVDNIYEQAVEMEEISKALDQYSKHLEDKVKKIHGQKK
ncbi:unnamed protein product [Cunninghamella blakesleeana]